MLGSVAVRPALDGRHHRPVGGAIALVSAAILQVVAVDRLGGIVGDLDLPLVAVVSLTLIHPHRSAIVAAVGGLVVDAFGHRLFGIHCVAYAVVGPTLTLTLGALAPIRRVRLAWAGAWRAPALAAGVAGAVSTAVVVGIVAVVDGGLAGDAVTAPLGAGLWTSAVVAVTARLLGTLGPSR